MASSSKRAGSTKNKNRIEDSVPPTHPTTSTALDAAVSHSSATSASSLPSPIPATATSLPSPSTLLPTVATSPSSATSDHEEGARELESAAKNGLQAQFDAPGSSSSSSEFSKTEEGSEGDDTEDQIGKNVEPSVDPPTSPGNTDISLPPDSGGAAV
nr:putative protein TPRXL [Nicotiana tomentosiformis]